VASALEELTKSEREALPLIMERLEQAIAEMSMPGGSVPGGFFLERAKVKVAQCWLGILRYTTEVYAIGELAMKLRRVVAMMTQGDVPVDNSDALVGSVGPRWIGSSTPNLGHVRQAKILTVIAVIWIDQDLCEDVIES